MSFSQIVWLENLAKNHEAGKAFLMVLICFFASIRHVFAVMAVKRISIKVAKLDGSKNLPKYGDRATASFPRNSGKAASSFRRRSRSMR